MTSPIHHISNNKNHRGIETGYQYLVKHHKVNHNVTKCDSYKPGISIVSNSFKGRNVEEKKYNNYLNLKPIIERIIPVRDLLDNTDPRNDEGQWEVLGIRNNTNDIQNSNNSYNNQTNTGELDDFFINNKVNNSLDPVLKTSSNNVTNAGELNDFFNNNNSIIVIIINRNYTGDLNDFFRRNNKAGNAEMKSSNSNDTNLNTETKKFSGDLNDFFRDDKEVNENRQNQDSSGELNDFFRNVKVGNEIGNRKKETKIFSGELNDFFINDKERGI